MDMRELSFCSASYLRLRRPCRWNLSSVSVSSLVMMRNTLLLLSIVFASACGPNVDVATSVQVEELTTGWMGAGAPNGLNKVVPALSFKLKNVSAQQLPTLQVNAVFRRVSQTEEWGNGFRTVSGSAGLAPGAATGRLTINAQLGYTGADPRDALLRNSQFIDAKVDLFARYGSRQWTRLGEFPIARQLID
jgi:hypothetical protein